MDHQEFLGNNIKKIAFEKSGIIKENSKVIISKQKNAALKVIKNEANKVDCKTYIYGNDFKAKYCKNSFLFITKRKKIKSTKKH